MVFSTIFNIFGYSTTRKNYSSNMNDTDENENSGSDLSDEEVHVTEEVPLSPQTQCDQSISPSMSKSRKTSKRKNLNITELLEKRSKERTQLMTQICSKKNTVDDDDVDHFFKSLAISVKKLPPHLIAQAKLKMLTVLTDLQFHDPGNRYTTPKSNRVLITPSQSTTSSTHSLENHYTPYNYSPPSISSPSYTNSQQQFGSSNI
ncbi:uncharacterized protein LOC132945811 isoform X1 [Metopolophium dirhodum]|uniref:uncharacterized protein LOC132945811 isoform X1 n=1 Tax=Metopolophium dirhodum TaxID=44670 RepID=UPI00298F77BF|nr:uncharacterized protein LOC132945811 isoform X1 [Metopolophium dirhodum]XP_060871563.1 uncharacterized protein LOC132945811 isoform X1 [Metopolophium dirhodum]